jgi:NOL1/NOP2/fmu family ribosome biogenesis protein
MEKRFGMKRSLFDGYLLFSRRKSWWILHRSDHILSASPLKVSMAGMKAFHRVGQFIKPTTRMTQCFGKWATKSILELEDKQVGKILSGGDLPLDLNIEEGYVIMTYKDRILGLGLYVKRILSPQLPREAKRCLSVFPLSLPPKHTS